MSSDPVNVLPGYGAYLSFKSIVVFFSDEQPQRTGVGEPNHPQICYSNSARLP
jgi:hypothetical protein